MERASLAPLVPEMEFAMFEVTGFELYSSVLTAGGAMHYVEMRQEF